MSNGIGGTCNLAMGSLGGSRSTLLILLLLCLSLAVGGRAQTLAQQFTPWTENARFTTDTQMQLTLDQRYAAGAGSVNVWTYVDISAYIKMPPFDSAGTVTTFYMSSQGDQHYELDMEFLGNTSGQPFLLHTNVFVDGVGGREQQMYLGFDPSADFHYYRFRWSKDMVVFYVDNKPVRVFKNLEGTVPGTKYLNQQAMGVYISIWDGSSWATQGGRVPINWASAPFTATYQDFALNGCVVDPNDPNGVAACQNSPYATGAALSNQEVYELGQNKAYMMKYDYCDDRVRYPDVPPECPYNNV